MKVFLVSSCSLPMVGIEQCCAFIVYPAYEAAFFRQYAGRILLEGGDLLVLLPIPVTIYRGR